MTHTAACRWQRTTEAECEYRATHHYCPHPEHACDCPVPAPAVPAGLAAILKAVTEYGTLCAQNAEGDHDDAEADALATVQALVTQLAETAENVRLRIVVATGPTEKAVLLVAKRVYEREVRGALKWEVLHPAEQELRLNDARFDLEDVFLAASSPEKEGKE